MSVKLLLLLLITGTVNTVILLIEGIQHFPSTLSLVSGIASAIYLLISITCWITSMPPLDINEGKSDSTETYHKDQ
jgi:hypothetical protein